MMGAHAAWVVSSEVAARETTAVPEHSGNDRSSPRPSRTSGRHTPHLLPSSSIEGSHGRAGVVDGSDQVHPVRRVHVCRAKARSRRVSDEKRSRKVALMVIWCGC